MGRGSLRRRFAVGAVVSAGLALALFGAITFTLVVISEGRDDGEDPEEEPGESPAEEAAELVLNAMAIATPIAFAGAVATAAALSRRTTRPLERAIRAARATGAHDLTRRLDVPEEEGELRDLVVALNDLFARLDDGFGALGRFAADASHELRTPLTVIAAELEVGLRRPRTATEWEASATAALAQLRRLSAVVDGLLSLARAGADTPGARREVELGEIVDGVVMQMGASAERAGIALVAPEGAPGVRIDANPTTIETAIRNLVENAISHARSRVEVAVEAGAGRVRVIVDDDGAGLGADPDAMLAPLVRGGAPASRAAGAGLGLAIVRRVAEGHGGRLIPGAAPSGGARMVLELPVVERA